MTITPAEEHAARNNQCHHICESTYIEEDDGDMP